jgi:hypothetical protein
LIRVAVNHGGQLLIRVRKKCRCEPPSVPDAS